MSLLFILLYLALWSFSLYGCGYSLLIFGTTTKDRSIGLSLTVVSRGCLLYFRLCLTSSWKLLKICRIPYADGRVTSICKTDCYWNLWALRNSRLCDTHYLRFRTGCRTRKCSYPTPNSCDLRIAWIGSPGFRSRLDFWSRLLKILQSCAISLYIFHRLGDGREGNFRCASLTISLGQKS